MKLASHFRAQQLKLPFSSTLPFMRDSLFSFSLVSSTVECSVLCMPSIGAKGTSFAGKFSSWVCQFHQNDAMRQVRRPPNQERVFWIYWQFHFHLPRRPVCEPSSLLTQELWKHMISATPLRDDCLMSKPSCFLLQADLADAADSQKLHCAPFWHVCPVPCCEEIPRRTFCTWKRPGTKWKKDSKEWNEIGENTNAEWISLAFLPWNANKTSTGELDKSKQGEINRREPKHCIKQLTLPSVWPKLRALCVSKWASRSAFLVNTPWHTAHRRSLASTLLFLWSSCCNWWWYFIRVSNL